MADFPTALSEVVDNVDDVLAKHINNLEAKVGIDNGTTTTSLDYMVRNHPDSIYRQAIINGGCNVAQRGAGTLSTSAVYGQADRIYCIAEGTVGGGTITQGNNLGLGNRSYHIICPAVTLTGAGKIKAGYRMEAKDALWFKGQTASFSVRVYHNVGSAKTYTIYVNKANAADNFSAVTAIGNNGGTSVANLTETLIKYENISLGDCSNGIEIIVESNCGEVSAKNFYWFEFQFNLGSIVLPFQPKSHGEELAKCLKYAWVPNGTSTTRFSLGWGAAYNTTGANIYTPALVPMRTIPTLTATAGDWQLWNDGDGAVDVTALTIGNNCTETMLQLTTTVASGLTAQISYTIKPDASVPRTMIFSAEL